MAAFRVLDLRTVAVGTADLDAAVATFRKNFALADAGESSDADARRARLAIGPATIEFATPTGGSTDLARFVAERGGGIFALVMTVDDLEAAVDDLRKRGVETRPDTVDGKPAAVIPPEHAHGARIVLVAR
jgi:hypothetical protein